MKFSLIVCTVGRRDELTEFFESLLRQPHIDFEIILVDQNPDDCLTDIVAQFIEKFPLKHIRISGPGLSRARNAGLTHATGELIGFPDDDCKYFDQYLTAVKQAFEEDASIGCITGYPTDSQQPPHADWRSGKMDLDTVTVLNRCQEFTVFVRAGCLGDVRYNERMGLGAQTLWGADEGPDFLIRLIQRGCRTVHFPSLFVYHPNKIATITRQALDRAASYARGRGALLRLHHFPLRSICNSLFRPTVGCGWYLLRFEPKRSAYYFAIVRGLLRGLLMSRVELADLSGQSCICTHVIEPLRLSALPPRPLVSVLIANYNYARFLPNTLDSLLAQTYNHWQAVVCDDGSTDNSVDVVSHYVRRDARIHLVQKANGGQTSTVNACYTHLNGEILCLLDADDVFDPGKIERVVAAFAAAPQAGMCNHFSRVIDAEGLNQDVNMHHRLDEGWLANQALHRGACVYVPTTSCMSLRREIAELLFPIPDRQKRDVDGYLGMVAQFLSPLVVINQPLSDYRVHGNNMGGLTEPTPERLQYELRLVEQRTANVKDFVSQRFGREIAQRIALEDNPQYIQAALKLLAIEKADGRLRHALALIRRHPNASWRAIWRAIFAVPGPLSRRAVPMLHRSHRAKATLHRLLGRRKAVAT